MHIHQPEITHAGGSVRVSAHVEFDTPNVDVPPVAWFEVPETYAHMLSDRADGFAVALQTLAMFYNEPLRVGGALSPRLHYGLQQAQRAFNFYNPTRVHRVDIHADNLTAPPPPTHPGVSTLFSGGIDSVYTLYRHLPQNQPLPQYRVTHAFFVHGFDISLHKTDRFQTFYDDYQPLLQSVGVALVPVTTNIRQFYKPFFRHPSPLHGMSYGTAFPSMGMLFSRGLHAHFIPASIDLSTAEFIGTHPAIENYYRTETLQVFSDAVDKSRTDKLDAILNWQEALDVLRVCIHWIPAGDLTANCCRCYKCAAAMIRLDLNDALHRSPSFPKPRRIRDLYKAALSKGFADPPFFADTIERAANQRRWGLFLHLHLARWIYRARFVQLNRRWAWFRP